MGDTVAILPELSFRQQVVDLATHISRSLPTASDANASREYITSVESSLGEGEDVEQGKRVEVVKGLVAKVNEGRGALEGTKESDVELSHLLLQNIISTTLQSSDFESAVRTVVEAIRKGADANLNAGRLARVEVAARIINNIYNALPSSSLRPAVLLALLNLLTRFTDLSVLPISAAQIRTIAQSAAKPEEWLRAVSDVYAQAGQWGLASDIVGAETERGVVLGVCDEKRFEFGQGKGEAQGLVRVLNGQEEVKAWTEKNAAWIESQGVPKFTAALITHKTQLLALARLFTSSPTRSLSFSSIASSLGIYEDEVDEYIFDGTAAGLFEARIDQTSGTVKVVSVSRAAGAGNGKVEWELLGQRLGEWKKAVGEARRVVGEAEAVAAQPVSNNNRDGRDGRDNRGERKGEYRKKDKVEVKEEVAA